MSVGYDLGYLKSSSTGLSYIDRFAHSTGTTTKSYSSDAFSLASEVKVFVSPTQNIPASTIPTYPTISTSLNQSTKSVSVTASGGNVSVNILVFVR